MAGRFRSLHRQLDPLTGGKSTFVEDFRLTADLVKSRRVRPLLATVHPFTTLGCKSDFEGDLADPSGRYRKGRA